MDKACGILDRKGVKATPNRILVLRSMLLSERPLSLSELETMLDSVDRSSIFRVLTLFAAHHIVHEIEDGSGMIRVMRNALRDANLSPDAIGHINAHATSTMLGDRAENKAVKEVFGEHAKKIKISATKSMTGHLLGASGGIESVFTALALYHETLPGTINLVDPDPECDLDYLAGGSEHVACEYAMCNSFGFGGTNASIILRKWTE